MGARSPSPNSDYREIGSASAEEWESENVKSHKVDVYVQMPALWRKIERTKIGYKY